MASAHVRLRVIGLKHDIAMGNHGPFGRARCAGCVNQYRHIIGFNGINAPVPLLGKAVEIGAPQFIKRVNEHDFRVVKPFQPFIFHHNDFLNIRQRVAHFQIFVELFFIFHHQKARGRIAANMLKLHGRVGGVNAIGYAATAHGGEVEIQPFLAVFGQYRHHIAGLQTKRHQRGANFAGAQVKCVPVKTVPNAKLFFAQGNTASERLTALAE